MTKRLQTIHPFPARMAPDTLSEWIDRLPPASHVLDPMCGSGVVVRQSLLAGHNSTGFDVDPLAVLMSSVWTKQLVLDNVEEKAEIICKEAKSTKLSEIVLPWIDNCEETTKFTKYWFATRQRNCLRRLVHTLRSKKEHWPRPLNNVLLLALSRVIITKQAGASLAWDISHSRPHKAVDENDFDVYAGFIRAAKRIAKAIVSEDLPKNGKIYCGDARNLRRIKSDSIDAIFTSPPYLNAIDYLRGHKFSLVWMGYTIPELRKRRSESVGAERAPAKGLKSEDVWAAITKQLPSISQLDPRQQRIVERYVYDADKLLREFRRILKPGAQLALVLGDSMIRGHYIENSKIFDYLANQNRFERREERRRSINIQKRYLPIVSKNNTLENRMRCEIIQIYAALS